MAIASTAPVNGAVQSPPTPPSASSASASPQSTSSSAESPASNTASNGNNTSIHQKGRAKISVWGNDVWQRIDHAVDQEVKRTRIGKRFLKTTAVPSKTTSVPTDSYVVSAANPVLSVDEGTTTSICEYYVEFEMTPQQVDQEEGDFKTLGHSTAVTLATKAANTIAQGEDTMIFQGRDGLTAGNVNNIPTGSTLFTQDFVLTLNGNQPADTGLLNFPVGAVTPGAGPSTPEGTNPIPVVPVPPLGGN